MNSLDYIKQNFLTLAQLSDASGVSVQLIKQMIGAGCLPGPAYEVLQESSIRSVFGEHEEQVTAEYYPHSHVAKAQDIERSGVSLAAVAAEQRRLFDQTYIDLLRAEKAAEFGLGHLCAPDGCVKGPELDAFLDTEWQHYLDGTYGLCTRSASFEEIAIKEIMIAKIKCLLGLLDAGESAVSFDDLAEAVDRLDTVSSPFAPHERQLSSRGQWIDSVRATYLAGETRS